MMTLFEHINIIDDQHRRWRCDRLWDLLIEMILDSLIFPWTFANEASNAVFVDCKPFANTSKSFVTARSNQPFNVGRSNIPRVGCT